MRCTSPFRLSVPCRVFHLLEIGKRRNFKFGGDMTLDMCNWKSKFEVNESRSRSLGTKI